MIKSVMVKSLFDCFDYVADYKGRETFAIISIQDAVEGGFGFRFIKTPHCLDVLTLYFDDTDELDGSAAAFTPEQARQVIDFIRTNKSRVDRLLIHCYAGQSRSLAVGAFAVKMLGADNRAYFAGRFPNRLVYDTLVQEYSRQKAADSSDLVCSDRS